MYILGIETTGPFCSVALINEKGEIIVKESKERLNHLKTLMPMIEELLKESEININDIDAIAASIGPGSFTGIRIGVTTARSLAQMTGLKCIGVPTLLSFGKGEEEKYMENSGQDLRQKECVICPIFDARRKQIYACCVSNKEAAVEAGAYDTENFLLKVEAYMNKTGKHKAIFVGDGVAPYGEIIKETMEKDGFEAELKEETYQKADFVVKEAIEMYKKGEVLDYESLKPEYMRKPEAQRNLEERLKNSK